VPARGLRPRLADVVIGLVVAVVQVAGTFLYSRDESSRWAFDVFAMALLLAGPAALVLRRRWPEAVVIVTFAAAAGYSATGYPRGPAGIPAFMVAVITAIVMGRRLVAWVVVAVAVPAFTWLPYLVPDDEEQARSVAASASNQTGILLVAAASELVRVRLERRAERGQMQREAARQRASAERLLIARELHDVLAHHISLISVQSKVALHLMDEQPERARPALEAINRASDEALGELRSVLDVLSRGIDDRDGGAWAPLAPTAGIGDLDGLLARTRTAGLDVELRVEGEARSVPTGIDVAALRVVQEALTNVVRHGGAGARAVVYLRYEPAELVVQVDDDGLGNDAEAEGCGAGTGRGIAGMRERVHALDGTFEARPRPGRGFRVRARFPTVGPR
jgi:signal transduction histidine kinase